MKELFANNSVDSLCNTRRQKIIDEIALFSDDEIMNANFDEWVLYYFEMCNLHPLLLEMDNKSESMEEVKISKKRDFKRTVYDSDTVVLDGYKVTFSISFEGDRALLLCRPSHH